MVEAQNIYQDSLPGFAIGLTEDSLKIICLNI